MVWLDCEVRVDGAILYLFKDLLDSVNFGGWGEGYISFHTNSPVTTMLCLCSKQVPVLAQTFFFYSSGCTCHTAVVIIMYQSISKYVFAHVLLPHSAAVQQA